MARIGKQQQDVVHAAIAALEDQPVLQLLPIPHLRLSLYPPYAPGLP
jgi:hypothetical protein